MKKVHIGYQGKGTRTVCHMGMTSLGRHKRYHTVSAEDFAKRDARSQCQKCLKHLPKPVQTEPKPVQTESKS